MRKNFAKRIGLLATVSMIGLAAVGCGGAKADATTAAETTTVAETTTTAETTVAAETITPAKAAGEALTEDEYIAKTEELSIAMTTASTNAQTELGALTEDDVDKAKTIIDELKAPFVEFAEVVAPEKYAAVQEKYKSGCYAMIEYLDLINEVFELGATGEEPSAEATSELTTKMTTLLTTIQTDFTDGANLMIELVGGEAVDAPEETTKAE